MKKMRFHLFWLSVVFGVCQLFCSMAWAADPGKDGLVSVILKIDVAPLAAYKGGVEGLAATDARVIGEKKLNARSERSKAYLEYMAQRMKTTEGNIVALAPQARVTHRYSHVF